ncbi:hypothetical protein J6590_014375 [Homalodisca vitripennis]|nr:hypothetical protein J6590_014375 [Homalodisca vitripennis]
MCGWKRWTMATVNEADNNNTVRAMPRAPILTTEALSQAVRYSMARGTPSSHHTMVPVPPCQLARATRLARPFSIGDRTADEFRNRHFHRLFAYVARVRTVSTTLYRTSGYITHLCCLYLPQYHESLGKGTCRQSRAACQFHRLFANVARVRTVSTTLYRTSGYITHLCCLSLPQYHESLGKGTCRQSRAACHFHRLFANVARVRTVSTALYRTSGYITHLCCLYLPQYHESLGKGTCRQSRAACHFHRLFANVARVRTVSTTLYRTSGYITHLCCLSLPQYHESLGYITHLCCLSLPQYHESLGKGTCRQSRAACHFHRLFANVARVRTSRAACHLHRLFANVARVRTVSTALYRTSGYITHLCCLYLPQYHESLVREHVDSPAPRVTSTGCLPTWLEYARYLLHCTVRQVTSHICVVYLCLNTTRAWVREHVDSPAPRVTYTGCFPTWLEYARYLLHCTVRQVTSNICVVYLCLNTTRAWVREHVDSPAPRVTYTGCLPTWLEYARYLLHCTVRQVTSHICVVYLCLNTTRAWVREHVDSPAPRVTSTGCLPTWLEYARYLLHCTVRQVTSHICVVYLCLNTTRAWVREHVDSPAPRVTSIGCLPTWLESHGIYYTVPYVRLHHTSVLSTSA